LYEDCRENHKHEKQNADEFHVEQNKISKMSETSKTSKTNKMSETSGLYYKDIHGQMSVIFQATILAMKNVRNL
jgi:hypothetical protein